MQYRIQITELLNKRLVVDANSAEEAKQKVEDAYYNGDVVLTADDYIDGSVQIEIIECLA